MKASGPWHRPLGGLSVAGLKAAITEITQLMGRQVLLAVTGLGVVTVLTRALQREGFGTYQFTLGIASALAFLALPSLKQVVLQETAKNRHGILYQASKLRLKGSLVHTLALLAVSAYYGLVAEDGRLSMCFLAAALTFPVASALDTYQPYLLGRRAYGSYSRATGLVGLASGVGTVLVTLVRSFPAAAVAATGISQALAHLSARALALRRTPLQNSDCSASALRFGVGLSLVGALPMVSGHLSTVLVGGMLSMSDVAVLTLALLPVSKSKALLAPLGEFLAPRVVSQTGRGLFRRATRVMLVYVGIVLAYVVVTALAMPLAFGLLFPDYRDAVPAAQLGMCTLLLSAPAAILELTIFAQERLGQTTLMRAIEFVFDVCVTYGGVRLWGVTGAIAARLLSSGLRSAVAIVFFLRNREQAFVEAQQAIGDAGAIPSE